MESPEEARKRAEQAFQVSPFTQNATEQSIPNAETRNAFNNELNQQRSTTGQR
jgi:hypothetical protein